MKTAELRHRLDQPIPPYRAPEYRPACGIDAVQRRTRSLPDRIPTVVICSTDFPSG
jgi:hypothetical protein